MLGRLSGLLGGCGGYAGHVAAPCTMFCSCALAKWRRGHYDGGDGADGTLLSFVGVAFSGGRALTALALSQL